MADELLSGILNKAKAYLICNGDDRFNRELFWKKFICP